LCCLEGFCLRWGKVFINFINKGENMAEVTLGLFSNSNQADKAIKDLKEAGFDAKEISVVMKDQGGGAVRKDAADDVGGGMVRGGVAGGLAGLIYGIAAVTIPGLGGILFVGPLAAALGLTGVGATTATGAVLGSAAGGLLGMLSRLGIRGGEAKTYESRIREGGILLAVPTRGDIEAERILREAGADNIKKVDTP
jgi:uncharacterized membrane protein